MCYCQALANYSSCRLTLNVFMFPPGLLCCFWPPSWLKPTRPPDVSPGPPGRPGLTAQTASAPTSDGWQTTYPPSGCQEHTSTFSPRLTSSTRPWRSVSLLQLQKNALKQEPVLTFPWCFIYVLWRILKEAEKAFEVFFQQCLIVCITWVGRVSQHIWQ